MSLCTLPTITESRFTSYFNYGYTGSYSGVSSFTTNEFSLPAIVVKAGAYSPIEPDTHVYAGKLSIAVVTQIDDVEAPLEAHDAEVSRIYDLLADKAATLAYLNESGNSFGCHNFDITSFNQDRDERSLISELSLDIYAQTLELP